MSAPNYITEEVKEPIGRETEWVKACDDVARGVMRRFQQAVMDEDPSSWNDSQAQETRYRGVVAPPPFRSTPFDGPLGRPIQ